MIFQVKRVRQESPTTFADRFGAALRKYTTLDPSSDMGNQQLISVMLGQSSPDIRFKLQKIKEPASRDLEALMGGLESIQ